MDISLGSKLSALRREHGYTQDFVADRLGVSPQAVSKWENDLSCPDVMLLPKIAALFGVTIDMLLSNERKPAASIIPAEKRGNTDDMLLKVIVDSGAGERVRINLPFVLVKTALEIGFGLPQISANAHLENIDLEKVLKLVDMGLVGRLVEVDTADGTHVEIVVE